MSGPASSLEQSENQVTAAWRWCYLAWEVIQNPRIVYKIGVVWPITIFKGEDHRSFSRGAIYKLFTMHTFLIGNMNPQPKGCNSEHLQNCATDSSQLFTIFKHYQRIRPPSIAPQVACSLHSLHFCNVQLQEDKASPSFPSGCLNYSKMLTWSWC